MIYAELRKEDSGQGYFTLRYLVFNGDIIGSYGIHYKPWDHAHSVPYGASRDYHRLATPEQAAAYACWEAAGDDKHDYDSDDYLPYGGCYNECNYHDDRLSICDGSSLVEITDNEQRAFEIAAMMAEVSR